MKNNSLIYMILFCNVPNQKVLNAILMSKVSLMFKIVIVSVGILWASLVLISWGSVPEDKIPARSALLERSGS